MIPRKYKVYVKSTNRIEDVTSIRWNYRGEIHMIITKIASYFIKPHNKSDYMLITFTGKQDGHQNELYTGDIVTSTEYPFQRDGKYNYHGVIEWSEEAAAFVIRKVLVDGSRRGISDGISDYLAEYDLETFEKLGNVYEHGDLLEKV